MTPDDDNDFMRAMQGVRRLNKNSTPPLARKSQGNRALRDQMRQRALHPANERIETGPVLPQTEFAGQSNSTADTNLFYLRHGVQKKVLRDLKKGQRYPTKQILDLHGLTQAQAQAAIDRALQNFQFSGLACLLIIHGKGLGSAQGPVLKRFTSSYLRSMSQVRAYCSASLRDGGTGALYVLVKGV